MEISEALEKALSPPEYYYGVMNDLCRHGWARVWGVHRDSDILEVSNWHTVLNSLESKYPMEDDLWRVERSRHWAVGWMDTLLVRALICDCENWEDSYINVKGFEGTKIWWCSTCQAEATVQEIFWHVYLLRERVKDYPVLDEDDFTRREHEALMEYLEQEVGEENVEALATYLLENYNISNPDDVRYEWIEEWQREK